MTFQKPKKLKIYKKIRQKYGKGDECKGNLQVQTPQQARKIHGREDLCGYKRGYDLSESEDKNLTLEVKHAGKDASNHKYVFDHIIDPSYTQAQVFDVAAIPLLKRKLVIFLLFFEIIFRFLVFLDRVN